MDKCNRILIVDDDESIRNTMKTILEDEGYVVDVAASGKEALKKTDTTTYNIAMLDIRLPDMEGVELLKLMKDTVPKMRKIMVTGYPSMQNAIAALNKSADAYLVKPINVEKLLSIVKEQLKIQDSEREYTEFKVAEFIEARVNQLQKTEE